MENQIMDANSLTTSDIEEDYAEDNLTSAIENNDFILLYQLIDSLEINSFSARHYEVFIRLMAEEEYQLPPGAFFPLAEKLGLMPTLDRWVVRNVLRWASNSHSKNIPDAGSMFFVNLAGATIRDLDFPQHVQMSLQEYGLTGNSLCFEIPGEEAAHSRDDVARFTKAIRKIGCCVAISGFDRDKVTFELIKNFQVDFLKIDGNIIFNIHRESLELAKTIAIHKAAKKLGIKTVAEFVESEEDISKLREIGVDFAQGFGISKPSIFEVKHSYIGGP